MLKSEGWNFFSLNGAYNEFEKHGEAFSLFSAKVENLIQTDVQTFISTIAKEAEKSKSHLDRMLGEMIIRISRVMVCFYLVLLIQDGVVAIIVLDMCMLQYGDKHLAKHHLVIKHEVRNYVS